MATAKAQWESLTGEVRETIEAHTGPVAAVEMVSGGFNSEIAARVHTTAGSRVFVKGLRSDHPRVWTQHQEARINPHVVPIAPRLLWHVETGGWNLLGFEHIDGRRADYSPASDDLAKIEDCLGRLGEVTCPDLPVKRAEQRWSRYCDAPELLAGNALLHTDWNPGNVVVNHTAHVVDWAWPTSGAAWIDPACWVVWLIAEGHTPAEAETWVTQVAAWQMAPADGLDVFSQAQAHMWDDIAQDDPDPWAERIANAAAQWATHRRS